MIVVDANILIYFTINGEYSERCYDLHKRNSDWISPCLWKNEVANVLATYERIKMMKREDSIDAFLDMERVIDENEYNIPIESILEVSARNNCSAYDAQYVCLAEYFNTELYTFDKKILKNCPHVARKP